jgi:hypothetical protein
LAIIKSFNDFKRTTESHSVNEPVVKEPKVLEPKTKEPKVQEPTVKRKGAFNIVKPSIDKATIKEPTIKKENVDNTLDNLFNSIKFVNKIAIFEKVIKAHDAFLFLESAKVDNKKLWYFLMERNDTTLQIVKYNPKEGFNLKELVEGVIIHYKSLESIRKHLNENITIDGSKEYVVISNLTPVMKAIIKSDLIKLLSK